MKKCKKIFALALVLLCVILVFTSCGNTSGEKETVSDDAEKITGTDGYENEASSETEKTSKNEASVTEKVTVSRETVTEIKTTSSNEKVNQSSSVKSEEEPIKLKMTYTDNKVSLKDSTDYSVDIKSLHMIKDTDGYNYLVLNYSIKNETNQKIEMGMWSGIGRAKVLQNGTSLDRYHYLSRESKEAYAGILTGSSLSPTELRPYEVWDITNVYEVYDLSSDITVMFSPISYVTGTEEQVSIVRRFSF